MGNFYSLETRSALLDSSNDTLAGPGAAWLGSNPLLPCGPWGGRPGINEQTAIAMKTSTASQHPWMPLHWMVLSHQPYTPAGPVGLAPSRWVARLGLRGVPAVGNLPAQPLDRTDVRTLCRCPRVPVLFGYVCAMAWGGQGMGPTRPHAISAWEARRALEDILNELRSRDLTRGEAYDLFHRGQHIPGLGPSYWTKLLFFFGRRSNLYVMDQWVAKSCNLLTGRTVVPLVAGCPPRSTPASVYEDYCEEIDRIAQALGLTGSQAEEKMMSRGGRTPGEWRRHVVRHSA